jgi:hypothetical protein
MTGRVDLAAVAAAVLEETPGGGYRVRPGARRMVAAEKRCRLDHLQAVIVRTVAGTAIVYRPADSARMARDVWAEAWVAELPDTIGVTCHCRRNDPFRWADAIG